MCVQNDLILGNVVHTSWVSVQNWSTVQAHWPNLGLLVDAKWLKMVVSYHYLKMCSWNPIQTWCVHLLNVCSKTNCFLGNVDQILSLQWPENDWTWWFLTIIWKSVHTIQFKFVVRIFWVSVQNQFAFVRHWPNFGPLLAHKWLRLVVSDHYVKKYSHYTIQN